MNILKTIFAFSLCIFENVERKHLYLLAAGLTYYFSMSLFPALMVLAAVAAYLPLHGDMQDVTKFLGYVIPPQAASLFSQFLGSIRLHRTGLLSFGLITTVWLSSKGVKGIIAALDMVYEVRRPRRFWTNRVLAFGLTFGVGILLLLGVILSLAGPAMKSLLSRAVPVHSFWISIWPYLQWLPAAFFIFAAIEMLYLLAPNLPAQKRVTVPGAMIAAATCLALSAGLGFYFQHFGAEKLARFYEFLATPIAVMVWLYWIAFAILIGAEINSTLQSHRPSKAARQGEAFPRHRRDAA